MVSKSHYHFLLFFSPWPLLVSLCSFNFLFSILVFFKISLFMPSILSLLIIFCSVMIWWLFYSKEFNFEGLSSLCLEDGIKTSMILFISSEIFFFFSFFWAYFHFFFSPVVELSMNWPPIEIEMFDYLMVPMINTFVLMFSGATITISHYFLIVGKMKFCSLFLALTVLMGFIFSLLQWMEYNSSFFTLSDSTFGTSFYLLTGFHGLHVLIGSIFLSVVLFNLLKLYSSKTEFVSFELSSWYWHFVDVVWLFLYFCLYYCNN